MGRREQRESIFHLLFMTEFNPSEEIPEQKQMYLDNIEELQAKDQSYIQNKFDNWRKSGKMTVVDYSDILYDDILNMIKEWSTTSGKKYGFFRHDGIDKAFFKRLKNKEINKDLYDIRIYKVDDKVVGYSVIEHYPSFENHGHVYLIRKAVTDFRNLCLYIDYDTFREKTKYENNIIINWGCSSSGVKKYKLNKFKLAYIKKLYFYNLKKNQS